MPVFETEKGLIFFSHIPKCAGMSIEKGFSGYPTHLKNPYLHGKNQLGFPCSPQHFHAEIIQKMFNARHFQYTFSVVRNPFDRVSSEYRFRADIAKRQNREIANFDLWLQHSLQKYHADPYILDNHLRPQVQFLLPDMKVLKLEIGLVEIFKVIQEDIPGLSLDPPTHANVSNSSIPELSPKSIALITQMYSEDFEQLDYQA